MYEYLKEVYDMDNYDNEYYEPQPPKCCVCNKPLQMKCGEYPETEFYIIGGSFFEEPYFFSHDIEPVDYCCIPCYNNILLPLIKQRRKRYELSERFRELRNKKRT